MRNTRLKTSYSVTSLVIYETCPLQYYDVFVRGFPPPRTAGMARGVNVHKLIADHLSRPALFPSEAPEEVQVLLETFKRSRFNLAPVAVEQAFLLPFERGDVRGRIDLVLPRPRGGLEVVDFKSGSSRSREEIARSIQLPLYALAAGERFEQRPEEVSYTYFFLRDGHEVSFTPDAESTIALRERVEAMLRAIQEERFEPAPDCACFACRRTRRRNRRGGPRSM